MADFDGVDPWSLDLGDLVAIKSGDCLGIPTLDQALAVSRSPSGLIAVRSLEGVQVATIDRHGTDEETWRRYIEIQLETRERERDYGDRIH